MNTNQPSVTIYSTTLVLAYTHYYNCKFIPGRCLTDTHLRRLAYWFDKPVADLRSAKNHPQIAINLALLKSANLLAHNQAIWYLSPQSYQWIHQKPAEKASALLLPFETCQFETTMLEMGFSGLLTVDSKAYLQQQLSLERNPPYQSNTTVARWVSIEPERWQLFLSNLSTDAILFHLLQLGSWMPQHPLIITPDSIGKAIQQGYSLTQIQHFLEEATGTLFSSQQSNQLIKWYKRSRSIQLHPVFLLSVKKPEQLTHIFETRRLANRIKKQISPRHAVVSSDMQTPLQKWAVRHNYFLDHRSQSKQAQEIDPTGYQWLGLKLLVSLGNIIPLPYPAPHSELETLGEQFSPETLTQLSMLADQIIETIQSAIDGRDAFFPAGKAPDPALFQQIEAAMQQQTSLDICYRSLNAPEPKWHTIDPLRLEKKGRLHYLVAYSYRAERNLTFRLDRIETVRPSV